MTITQVFGQTVRAERVAKNISQEALAERSGLHRNAIGMIERGERSPNIESIYAIAIGLGVKASVLLDKAESQLTQ